MRILHIGDLHFRNKSNYEQDRVKDALFESLKSIDPIDFVFFSGDLVFSGTKPEDFLAAFNYLIAPLTKILNLKENSFFICQGNHDIDRTVCVESIINEFQRSTFSKDELNTWYSTKIADRDVSLNPSQNYFNFVSDSIPFHVTDIIDPLFTIHKRIIKETSVGIVTLNSSWLCSSFRQDKSELLIPVSLLEDAISAVKSCDYKIIMFHHPLSYFKEPIAFDIQDMVHSNFNILLVGHVHKEVIETQYKSSNGIFCNTTKAYLSQDGGELGYTVLNIDLNELGKIRLERFHYIKPENSFAILNDVVIQIPVGAEKYQQNTLRKKIENKYLTEIDEANLLLLNYDEDKKRGFVESFTEPVLSPDADEQTSSGESSARITLDQIYENDQNYIVFGKDKCGKTSLLKKILLDYLKTYSQTSIIPLYLDYKTIESKSEPFNIIRYLNSYFQINKSDASTIIDKGNLLVLIDNFDSSSSLQEEIVSFFSSHPKIRFIICSEYLTSRVFAEELDDLTYTKIFFKNLTRKEIRLYTKKIENIKEENHDLVIERVTAFCTQLQLPLNYWTISLILLIYKKGNDDYNKNLFSVLDSCVDEMLQKKRFAFEKTSLNFGQYKVLCAEIAYALFSSHKDTVYAAGSSTIILIIEDYIKRNPRIIVGGSDIFNFLFESGILKKKSDNKFTFRLNGIFEYFLAYYLKENEDFRNMVLSSESEYLSFNNELEIYSGFIRSDESFLRTIFSKTEKALESFNGEYVGEIDQLLGEKIHGAFFFNKSIKKLLVSSPLTEEQRDLVFDAQLPDIDSDVHKKELIDVSELNIEVIEKYLSILSRVFKNMDGVTNSQLIFSVFDYLLDSYCHFGFYMIDRFEENAKEENLRIRSEFDLDNNLIIGEEILKILSQILPVLVQTMLYDGIGHKNIKNIVEDRIKKYRSTYSINQYKLFVLYFLLLDLDLVKNKSLIDDIFEEISFAPLKVATLFKLNFFLAFKAFQNKPLEDFIKKKIQEAQLRIDSNVDVSDIQRGLAKQSKRNLVKKRR